MSMNEQNLDNLDADIEEALDNIEAIDEVHAQMDYNGIPVNIDIANIPDGMTLQDVLDHYGQTGVILTRESVDNLAPSETTTDITTTAYPTTYTEAYQVTHGVDIDTATIVSGTDAISVDTVLPEAVQTELESTEEEANKAFEKIEKKREKERADIRLRRDRRSIEFHTHYELKANDLMILVTSTGDIEIIKTDTRRTGKVRKLQETYTALNQYTGYSLPVLNNSLMFDKNMNPLSINYSPFKERGMTGIGRINSAGLDIGKYERPMTKKKYLIVNKDVFIRSNGKVLKIKHRVGFSISDVLKIKHKIHDTVRKAELFVAYIKDIVGRIYDEEHYEIVYNLNFIKGNKISNFYIFLQFPDLTITNSLEMSHTIENILTRMHGFHLKDILDTENAFRIRRHLSGMRTTFSPEDAYYGYNHSHISTGTVGWGNFCMGDDHFMSKIDFMYKAATELDLESVLIGVLNHISWESLEGGPYIRMEDIGEGTGQVVTDIGFNKILNIHSRGAIRKIFFKLKQKDISPLVKAFTLKMQSNKETSYVLDKKRFIEEFIKLWTEDGIRLISDEYDVPIYNYNPREQQFTTGSRRAGPDSWKSLLATARSKIARNPVAYMNGSYIKPKLVNTESPQKDTQNLILTFHPKIILYIANVIHYHLLNELKNVR